MSNLPSDYSLQILKDTITKSGPTRILLESGATTFPRYVPDLNDHFPMIIFIKKDGWSIGVHESRKEKAFALYPDEWIAYMDSRFPDNIFEIKVWKIMTEGVVKSKNRWIAILEEE